MSARSGAAIAAWLLRGKHLQCHVVHSLRLTDISYQDNVPESRKSSSLFESSQTRSHSGCIRSATIFASSSRCHGVNHPESLLVPLLMLTDYWLTVAGAGMRDSGYSTHFKTPTYELNPVWQKTIAAKRWFSARHLALTGVVGTACVLLSVIPNQRISDVFFGFALAVFGLLNGRHLSNLAIFAYVCRHPATLSGTVTMSHELVLWLSLFQLAPVMLMLMLIWVIAPIPQVTGAFVGVAALSLVHLLWIRRYRRGGKSVVR